MPHPTPPRDPSGRTVRPAGRRGRAGLALRTVVALAAVALPLAVAGGARAATPPATPITTPATTGERVLRDRAGRAVGVVRAAATTPAARRATRAYWTPSRMRAARPMTGPTGPDAAAVVRRRAAAPAGAAVRSGRVDRSPGVGAAVARAWQQRGGTVTAGTWPASSSAVVARTTGKVFFTLDGGDWVCSGSAADSPDGETVLTAGHCVNSGGDGVSPGAYATNWLFVAGYGTTALAPYGEFPGVHLATTTGWRTLPEDFDDDVALVDVGRNDAGQTLAQAVGGLPVGFGRARGEWVTALGYPAEAPFDGGTLTYCRGYLVQDTFGGSPDQGLRCRMTGGSSGGPWVGALDPRTGSGTVVSVTSFVYSGLDGYLWGTYLGATAKGLYDAVASTTSA